MSGTVLVEDGAEEVGATDADVAERPTLGVGAAPVGSLVEPQPTKSRTSVGSIKPYLKAAQTWGTLRSGSAELALPLAFKAEDSCAVGIYQFLSSRDSDKLDARVGGTYHMSFTNYVRPLLA